MLDYRQSSNGVEHLHGQMFRLDKFMRRIFLSSSRDRYRIQVDPYIVPAVNKLRQRTIATTDVQYAAFYVFSNSDNSLPLQEWGKHSLGRLVSQFLYLGCFSQCKKVPVQPEPCIRTDWHYHFAFLERQ